MDKLTNNTILFQSNVIKSNYKVETITVGEWSFLRESIIWSRKDDKILYYNDISLEEINTMLEALSRHKHEDKAKRMIVLIYCEIKYRTLKNL